jgi:radical SAM superfamily enzyme YgiQ (UPF0313 family)
LPRIINVKQRESKLFVLCILPSRLAQNKIFQEVDHADSAYVRKIFLMPHPRTPILLLHPPVAKPSEPPAGIARLVAALGHFGIPCTGIDMNLEGLLSLMTNPVISADRWTCRATRNLSKNFNRIRNLSIYHNLDRYQRAVADVNRVIAMSSPSDAIRLSLTNYQHRELSPVRSSDLIQAAEDPEENPFFPYFQERLIALVEVEKPALVGISLNYLTQALCVFAILGFLRSRWPEISLVLGGGLVTSWMSRPGWKNPFGGLVDHLVAGAGEMALLALAGIGGLKRMHLIPDYDFLAQDSGLGTRDSGLCIQDHNYFAPGFILPFSASSGCYWNKCAFCPERAEGNPYQPIPVNQVVNDLQSLVRKTQPVLLHLLDNALSPRLMKALSDSPPRVPWYGFARVTRHLADRGFCLALKRSGCIMLQLGIESGDQGVLDTERKGIALEVVSLALRSLRQAGIATYVYLLFGTPSETAKEARSTLAFTVQHADAISFLNLAIFNLPIHGQAAQELETRMHYEGDLSLYADFHHPRGWHRALVRQFLDKEFKRHPAIARIIRRDPPIFTSNHAPFFAMSNSGSP